MTEVIGPIQDKGADVVPSPSLEQVRDFPGGHVLLLVISQAAGEKMDQSWTDSEHRRRLVKDYSKSLPLNRPIRRKAQAEAIETLLIYNTLGFVSDWRGDPTIANVGVIRKTSWTDSGPF